MKLGRNLPIPLQARGLRGGPAVRIQDSKSARKRPFSVWKCPRRPRPPPTCLPACPQQQHLGASVALENWFLILERAKSLQVPNGPKPHAAAFARLLLEPAPSTRVCTMPRKTEWGPIDPRRGTQHMIHSHSFKEPLFSSSESPTRRQRPPKIQAQECAHISDLESPSEGWELKPRMQSKVPATYNGCLSIYLSLSLSLSLYISISLYLPLSLCIYASMCIYIDLCTRTHTHTHTRTHIHG